MPTLRETPDPRPRSPRGPCLWCYGPSAGSSAALASEGCGLGAGDSGRCDRVGGRDGLSGQKTSSGRAVRRQTPAPRGQPRGGVNPTLWRNGAGGGWVTAPSSPPVHLSPPPSCPPQPPAPQQVLTCTFLPGERGGCGRDQRASWRLGARRGHGAGGRKGRGAPSQGGRPSARKLHTGPGWLLGPHSPPPSPLEGQTSVPCPQGRPGRLVL